MTGSLIFPKRGEIWLVDFEPQKGAEIKKERPAIVINSDALGRYLPIKIVVPLTDAGKKGSTWYIPVSPDKKNGLKKESVVDCYQIRCASQERFNRKIGEISPDILSQITVAVAVLIDYQP